MRKEGNGMGLESKKMETRKKRADEEGKKFDEVFSHIESRVDLKKSQMEQQRAIEKLRERKHEPFEVDEKAVALALDLGEKLGRNAKALDRW